MQVSVEGTTVWMTVASIDLDIVRGVPHRSYDAKRQQWRAPITPRVVQYLDRFLNQDQRWILEQAQMAFVPHALPNYTFKTEPRDYQLKHLERSQDLPAYAYLFEPGLGKSKVAIDDACIARGMGTIKDAAVVCPNSITSNWVDEIEKHAPEECDIFVYDPSKKKQAKAFIDKEPLRMRWFIIAVESLSSGEGRKFLEAFLRSVECSLIVDESSRIKTHNADRTKALLALAPLAKRRRILSGTPFSKGLQDGWSQFSFLSSRILNGMNYYAFRNTFCVMAGFEGKQIVASKNEDLFTDLTAYYVGLERKADHLDLPKVYQKRLVRPTDAQIKALKELEKTGETLVDGGRMYFTNVLVKHLRMQQLAGGFAAVEEDDTPVDEGIDEFFAALQRGDVPRLIRRMEKARAVALPGANPKIEELLNVIEEIPGKFLVWCRFRPEIEAIAAALAKAHGPLSAVQFHGDIGNDERTEARRRFMNDDSCRFFVGQSRTGGIGLTLTAAQTAIYFSNDWSLETRIQSEDRNNRIGTVGTTLYIDLVLDYPKSIDSRILKALQEGRNYTDDLMEQMKEASNVGSK